MILQYYIILIFCIICNGLWIEKTGPKYPPKKGEVWPKPQYEKKENIFYSFNPWNFKFKVVGHTCDILTNAIKRYINIFRTQIKDEINNVTRKVDNNYAGTLHKLDIHVSSPCEEYPYFEMDESYFLTVSSTARLNSTSIWGALRGLESFSHLLYICKDNKEMRINKTLIKDFPRYQHRGLLLDTSRHYISLSNILKMLDAMAINKMNVLHWHIVDDQSFPYQSMKFPKLSELGAFDKSMVYTKDDINTVIQFARERGIRVIPEIDVPGHTTSWGNAYPSILSDCYKNGKIIGKGPMDPISNETYDLLLELFKEIQVWFPDKYFHLGGDEVQLDCWESNPKLQEYMKKHRLSASDLHALFMKNAIPLLNNNTKPIVWQEVFDEGVKVSKDTLIQVWKNFWILEIIKIIFAGHKLLFSSEWYLSDLSSEWYDFYSFDPRAVVSIFNDTALSERIIGGEACMWGEMVDDNNILSRVWPRASAVAEKLWSDLIGNGFSKSTIPISVYYRIEEHTCRMIRRGISAQPPSGPGFCLIELT